MASKPDWLLTHKRQARYQGRRSTDISADRDPSRILSRIVDAAGLMSRESRLSKPITVYSKMASKEAPFCAAMRRPLCRLNRACLLAILRV
jgi:hypothetical protein